ncbi:Bcr/CflA family efflux MFS transporter [Aquiluna sp. KACHI24]|uniref:Bcr/CflA family efflux MFS transporter n=1 Tax=Aquiluna sp. KACHI24 TaxID=2968831 RepID=UPI00222E3541|nr:Bcr/CflA family efflux MFS transporter [Aquiluna sp. KACHI24]
MALTFRLTPGGRVIDSGDQLNRRMLITYIFIVAFSISLIPYTIDPYLPAFPQIGEFFGVPNGTVQASLAGVTIGLAFGQLVAGPMSDAFGRRPLLLMAMFGFAASAIALFFVKEIGYFLVLRFTMGFFAASADVVSRAVVRDLFRGQPMLKMLSRVFLIQGLSPIIGPIVGSQLVSVFPWQSIFLTFGFFGLALAIASTFFLVETLPKAQRRSSTPIGLARGYVSVLKDRAYVGLLLVSALQLSALFGYLNTVSYLYQETFELSPGEFGIWFAVNSAALWLGVQFGGIMAKYFKAQWMLVVYSAAGALAGLYLMFTAGSSILIAEIGFFILVFFFGAPATGIPTLALLNHGSEAGTAASLMGVTNFTMTSIMSMVYAGLSVTSTFDVGLLIFSFFALSVLSLIFIVRPWTLPDLRKPLAQEEVH